MIRDVELRDFATIDRWRTDRGVAVLPPKFYPPDGVIEEGVAAGWLIKTDTNMALLEHWITNPDAEVEDRSKGIFNVAAELERRAKADGYEYIAVFSSLDGLDSACKRANYKELGTATMLGKEL